MLQVLAGHVRLSTGRQALEAIAGSSLRCRPRPTLDAVEDPRSC
jgi:hypothetical protein